MKIRPKLTCLTIAAAALLAAGCQGGSNGTGTPFNWYPNGQAPDKVGKGGYGTNSGGGGWEIPKKVTQPPTVKKEEPKAKKGHWETRTKKDCNGKTKTYRVWVQDAMLLPTDDPTSNLLDTPFDLVAYSGETSDDQLVPFIQALPQTQGQDDDTVLAWGGNGGGHDPCD